MMGPHSHCRRSPKWLKRTLVPGATTMHQNGPGALQGPRRRWVEFTMHQKGPGALGPYMGATTMRPMGDFAPRCPRSSQGVWEVGPPRLRGDAGRGMPTTSPPASTAPGTFWRPLKLSRRLPIPQVSKRASKVFQMQGATRQQVDVNSPARAPCRLFVNRHNKHFLDPFPAPPATSCKVTPGWGYPLPSVSLHTV